MRMTAARTAILETLLEAKGPLSLEEIQHQATERGGSPDYTTVFRLMLVLEKLGIAQKLNLHQSCSYYELLDPARHYDHLVCRQCGTVTQIENDCPVARAEKRIASVYGFTQLTHQLEFYGICPTCRPVTG